MTVIKQFVVIGPLEEKHLTLGAPAGSLDSLKDFGMLPADLVGSSEDEDRNQVAQASMAGRVTPLWHTVEAGY
jgi:hypothetical protein